MVSPLTRPAGLVTGRHDWHKSAPQKIAAAGDWSADSTGWRAWAKYLSRRETPRQLWRLIDDEQSPLLWAAPLTADEQPTAELVQWLYRLSCGRSRAPETLSAQIEAWLHGATESVFDVAEALQILAWVHALPSLATRTAAGTWWKMLHHFHQVATTATGLELNGHPLVHQLLAGELPLTLAYTLPELNSCRGLIDSARAALTDGCDRLLDGDGMLHGDSLAQFRPLLACWTRAMALGETLKGGAFSAATAERFPRLVRQALRLARRDGAQPLARGEASAWCPGLFRAAVKIDGTKTTRAIATAVLRPQQQRQILERPCSSTSATRLEKLAPFVHSSWSRLAVLRPRWSTKREMLVCNYASPRLEIELNLGASVFWSGSWGYDVQIDGRTLRSQGNWRLLHAARGEEADQLELEIDLADGVTLRRQAVLTHKDRLLLIADAVLAPQNCRIDYVGTLPLSTAARFEPAQDTREGVLHCGRQAALVLPLALPEWRRDPRSGQLGASAGQLELRQQTVGRSLYAPLLVSLDAQTMRQPVTWRQLTVAEDRQIRSADTAVGYRAQIGQRQWVVYRSLGALGQRTVLGIHLNSEFLLARFSRRGKFHPLLQTEAG
ncbi:MAG: hypothetical protein K1X74_15605 [Pirellulales bacterium]|nr:hypothetical protein [Pirellulales bacterium]